ncbi:YesL family protein [Oceanobacillus longus]|uniref:YesL family protein n=1 Tax=Oceanobacillus longus TaxID=930120 RepID=A0ABV8H2G6_9BACI
MKTFVNGYYLFSVWAMRLAYLNLLWIAFTLIGLILFGIMPATAAMFSVVRKWVLEEQDIPVVKTFWRSYKKEFMQANAVGLILAVIGYLLIIGFQILRAQESITYFIASYGVVALMLLFCIIFLYIFPLFAHFNLKRLQYFRWSIMIGVIHPLLTIFLVITLIIMHVVTFYAFPAMLFFFGGSVSAYITMWGVSRTFGKYEKPREDVIHDANNWA